MTQLTATLTVQACEVRKDDVVLTADGEKDFTVRHAMTTGKKARTTSLAPLLADPRHYRPSDMLTIQRPFRAPETVDLSHMAHLVLGYLQSMATPEEEAFSRGYDKGAGRAALRLWAELTGLEMAEAMAYAEHLATQSITAAVAPF